MLSLASHAIQPLLSKLLPFDCADFAEPRGELALVPPDSVSWRVFRNPVSLYIGGVAAVLLELGDPAVRAGVWNLSSFRSDPAARMRRTGLGAMITVFAARSRFEAYVAQVNAMHAKIVGVTETGDPFRADDPDLLLWVQATASFAFLAAYDRYVEELSKSERDLYYAEACVGAGYYGVRNPPGSEAALVSLFAGRASRLQASPVIQDFLEIMRIAPVLPRPLRPLQRTVTRAAIELLPRRLRDVLGLERERPLSLAERTLLRAAAAKAQRTHLPDSPWAIASARVAVSPEAAARSRS